MKPAVLFTKEGAERLAGLFLSLTDLIFPPICSFCGNSAAEVPPFEGICRSCLAKIPFRQKSAVRVRCVEEKYDERKEQNLRPNIEVVAVCDYEGMIRRGLISMKFYEASYMKHLFGSLASHAVQCQKSTFDGIIPVPLHLERLRERGYNQAELIAEGLSKRTGIPVINDCLSRSKNTKRQSAMKRISERAQNVSDAFVCRHPEKLAGKKVLLLDDILTSGETMMAAAVAIKKSMEDFNETCGNVHAGKNSPYVCNITGIVLATSRK